MAREPDLHQVPKRHIRIADAVWSSNVPSRPDSRLCSPDNRAPNRRGQDINRATSLLEAPRAVSSENGPGSRECHGNVERDL